MKLKIYFCVWDRPKKKYRVILLLSHCPIVYKTHDRLAKDLSEMVSFIKDDLS